MMEIPEELMEWIESRIAILEAEQELEDAITPEPVDTGIQKISSEEHRRYKLSALDIPLPAISWRRKPHGKWTVTDYKGFCVGVPHGTGSMGVVSELYALYESGR